MRRAVIPMDVVSLTVTSDLPLGVMRPGIVFSSTGKQNNLDQVSLGDHIQIPTHLHLSKMYRRQTFQFSWFWGSECSPGSQCNLFNELKFLTVWFGWAERPLTTKPTFSEESINNCLSTGGRRGKVGPVKHSSHYHHPKIHNKWLLEYSYLWTSVSVIT